MSNSLTIKAIRFDRAKLIEIEKDHRSTILILGHISNEANWLRKLLVSAATNCGDHPEGFANLGLAVTLITILTSKMYEGWKRINDSICGSIISQIIIPDDIKNDISTVRNRLRRNINKELIKKIRNKLSFHYPTHLDFEAFTSIGNDDCVSFVNTSGDNGDVFCQFSAISVAGKLTSLYPEMEWHQSYKRILNEITELVGDYCFYISQMQALLMLNSLSGHAQIFDCDLDDSPSIDTIKLHFFVRNVGHFFAPRQSRGD